MKLTIEIDLDNAAFEDGNLRDEVARILRRVIRNCPLTPDSELNLRDINGNTVGKATVHADSTTT